MHFKIKNNWYPSQKKVFEEKKRFIVVVCGRRWGKTRGAIQWILGKALEKPKSLSFWVSPTYRQSKIGCKYFLSLYSKSFYKGLIRNFNKTELKITLRNGSVIEFKSADNPQYLEGEGVDYMIIDEAGIVLKDEMLWFQSLRPMIMDTQGQVIFIGTPKGHGLFREFYLKGQSQDPEWISFRFPSYEGHMKNLPQEIESIKKSIPDYIYKQEIEAEFLEGGILFKNINEVCNYKEEEPSPGTPYTAGIDLAKYKDFTVVSIGHANRCIYVEKLAHNDWNMQFQLIKAILERFNSPNCVVDATGVGDVIVESMIQSGLNIEPIVFNNTIKTNLINNLILLFEKKAIQVIKNEALIDELKNFEFSIKSSGLFDFKAARGHDDMVISLALLFWGLRGETMGLKPILEVVGKTRETANFYKKDSMIL